MQSLRTRRSQAPRKYGATTAPSKLAKPGAAPTPRPRDTRKSRVDDKIKKRMSMRYADISSPTELNAVPALPAMPTSLMPGGGRMGAMGREGDEVVRDRTGTAEDARVVSDDKKLLDAEDFDPDSFLKLKLANSTEAELKSLQSSLHSAKDDTASELQRNVFKNYAEFVLISKEISTLENEMLELKDSLSEYKSMPSLLHIPDPTSTSTSTLSTYKRSSVADLRIMYFNQMQALHASIEGSAKFAPTTPGRHVVAEVDGVLSLNAATYKVVGRVKFVVMDDLVLVALRRRRANRAGAPGEGGRGREGKGASEGKLVAERCWPLSEMLVLDTKDSPSMTNVFKIRHGKVTHVYRTESSSDKKSLLSQFRAVAEELAAKKRKEREGEHERRKSMWQGGGDRMSLAGPSDRPPAVPDWMADLARGAGEPVPGTDAKEKAERDARWAGEWADELTVAIALKEWEKAVGLVEQGQAKLSITPPLAAKLPSLSSQLTTSLLSALSHPSIRKSTVVTLISLLLRLKAGPAARHTFLSARTKVLRALVRKIPFEGHVGAYVGDLAVVYFTGIKHTADWFLASFRENEVASAFIDWARGEIESYAEMFRRQVYSRDVESEVVKEAMRITYSQSKKLLQEYGLDFRFLLDELLLEHPKTTSILHPAPPISFRDNRVSKPPDMHPPTPSSTMSASSGAPSISRRRSPAPISTPLLTPDEPVPSIPSSATITYSPSRRGALPSSTTSATSPTSPYTAFTTLPTPTSSTYAQQPSQPIPITSSSQSRSRTPLSSTSGASGTSPASSSTPSQQPAPPLPPAPPIPLAAPTPRRARTPPPPSASSYTSTNTNSGGGPSPLRQPSTARDRPPRALRGSPAPPPRSANRPGSGMSAAGQGGRGEGYRGPVVAVPQREGMI